MQFIKYCRDITKKNNKLKLNICFAYNSDFEIERTFEQVKNLKHIDYRQIKQNLLISDFPDILIRTSNEKRLSNFLTFQSTYCELIFI